MGPTGGIDMAIANTEMAAAWDGPEGDHWTEHAERYESVGPAFWDALAAAINIQPPDAQVHPFERNAFDVVISNFGAMFFADPVAAFTNLAGAMRPGGRLGLLGWRQLSDNEWLMAIRAALIAGRDLPTTPPVGAPGPFGLADETHTRTVLGSAGLLDVVIERIDAPMRFGHDAKDAFEFLSTLGITRGLLQDLD